MATPPPVVVRKKRGLGCCGCGCFILGLLLLLFLGVMGLLGYELYTKTVLVTSPTATTTQTFDGGEDAYATTQQKMQTFDQDLHQHRPASLHLTANELNTLIAHDPDFAKNQVHLFVTMDGDLGRVQASLPTSLMSWGLIRDRYLNGDISLRLHYDEVEKKVIPSFQSIKIGEQEAPAANLPLIESSVTPALNLLLSKDAELKLILEQGKTIEIKNSELVIETQ